LDCHRTGGLAPMKLDTLGDIRKWQKNLKTHITNGTMPPWPAGPSSNFANGKNLTPKEKETLLAWIDAAYAPGEGTYAPTRKFGEWVIGTPDKTIALEK